MRFTPTFLAIAALFTTLLIASNLIAVKLIGVSIGSELLVLPAAIVVFPLSYIFGDVLTEVYGYARARQVIWLAFFCNLVFSLVVYVGQVLPAAPSWTGQSAYEQILGFTPRALIASFAAYLVGEFANSIILARMKVATKGRFLWARTIGSTVVGQGLDSLVFITIAFVGTPGVALGSLIVSQWLIKVVYEALATPLTYLVVAWLKRREGFDAFDYQTNFNPLALSH